MHDLPCRFEHDPSILVQDHGVASHLFIAREAVHNAVKHSQTNRIAIHLNEVYGKIRLEVRDFGVGIETDDQQSDGRGWKIMRHRAAIIGGTLECRTHVEGGAFSDL
jgi:nitrate/nitrite-specific signal transduction histidine kinase